MLPSVAAREPALDAPRAPGLARYGPLAAGVVLGKLVIVLVVFLTYKLLPFSEENFRQHFIDPMRPYTLLETMFSTWDGQHFLFLSEHGYAPDQLSNIQFPLYPALIHIVTPVFGNPVVAGLVVSNIASLIAVALLFDFVASLHGRAAARRTVLLMLAFPTAIFFSLVYSESIFLLLVIVFFRLLFSGRLGWAAVPAALLPLARAPGVLIAIPFLVYYLVEEVRFREPGFAARLFSPRILWVASPALGVVAYLAFMRSATGNAFELVNRAAGNGSGFAPSLLLHPIELFQHLTAGPLVIHGVTDSIIDRAVFLAFLLLLVPLARRVHPALLAYTLVMGLVSVASGSFVSYTRYVLVVFPVFITLALLLEGKRARFLQAPLLYLFTMIQGLFLVLYATAYWVA